MKTAFIGHRRLFAKDIKERLMNAIKTQIDNGCRAFIMGTHGEMDELALNSCRQFKADYKDLDIEVVITSMNTIKEGGGLNSYADIKTVMFEIEDIHYKQRITLSNKLMIDESDTLICYVDTSVYGSGAGRALRYAEKRGLKIVNLYREDDRPFYGMTKEQIDDYMKALSEIRSDN